MEEPKYTKEKIKAMKLSDYDQSSCSCSTDDGLKLDSSRLENLHWRTCHR